MSFSKNLRREQLSVVRMLGYALVLDNWDGWSAFTVVAEAQLTNRELAALAYSILRALRPDQAELVVEIALRSDASASFMNTSNGRAALIEWRETRDNRRRRAA